MYGLKIATAATALPVSLDEARQQVGVAEDTHHDAKLSGLIDAATEYVQTHTGRQLINATFDFYLDAFPYCDSYILLPRSPLVSITSVKYVNESDGVLTTWSSANYAAVTSREPGMVALAYQTAWPSSVRFLPESVVIRFVAGYGATALTVPVRAKQAILLLVSHWFTNREPVGRAGEIVHTLDALLEQLRVGEEFLTYG
jgi:uncharacterized phiE125 gp8 family phage protein